MDILVMTGQLLLGLAILVTLHEFGHYISARAFNIKVDKFFIFFDIWGKKLFSFKHKETEYGLGWLPLGGYVKIAGMIDESMDMESLKNPPQSWEFRSKPAWQRLIVMLGGVTVNVILGILIFSLMVFNYGESYIPNSQLKYGIVALELGSEIGLKTGDKIVEINGNKIERFEEIMSAKVILGENVTFTVDRSGELVFITLPNDFAEKITDGEGINFIDKRHTFFVQELVPNSNAEKAGLRPNDKILSVNGQEAIFSDQFTNLLQQNKNNDIDLTVKRNNEELHVTAKVDAEGKLGFVLSTDDFQIAHKEYGLLESFVVGNSKAWGILGENIKGLGKIFGGTLSASKSLHGPIGIATIYGGEWDWKKFWLITGLLSMVLAFVNVLPIPALDGGHALFLSMEIISGKKLSDKFLERTQIAGVIILLTLMTFVIGNDIWKHIIN